MPLLDDLMQHNIAYSTPVTEAEHKSEFEFTAGSPYLALTGELWGVCCEELGENWPRYNGTALYFQADDAAWMARMDVTYVSLATISVG